MKSHTAYRTFRTEGRRELIRITEDVQEALAKVRKRIGDLGWDIVQERLTQDKPRTLEELGQRWGVSRERVRQVELKTKHFLARYLSAFNQDEEQLEEPAEADAA